MFRATVPIIRRNNCVFATLGTCYSVWMTVWYAGWNEAFHFNLHTRELVLFTRQKKLLHQRTESGIRLHTFLYFGAWEKEGNTDMRRLTTRICYEKCVVRRFRRCANVTDRGELSYLATLGSENISAPYFKQCFFRGGLPPRPSQTPRLPVPRQK